MSKKIRNIIELQSILDKYALFATNKIANEVKKTIEEFIKYYYKEYTPEFYSRTWSFLNSVVKTEAKKQGNVWIAKVYIDTSIMYDNGWSMEGTAVQANAGMHGWYHAVKVGDMHFWDDAMEEIHSQDFLNKFVVFLRSKGLKVIIK